MLFQHAGEILGFQTGHLECDVALPDQAVTNECRHQ